MTLSKTRTGAIALTLAGTLAVAGCGSSSEDSASSSAGHDMSSMSTGTTTTGTSSSTTPVDQAFVRQMVPHHEMAVEMARIAQENGQRAEITALADDIIAAQDAEIAKMKKIAASLDVRLESMNGVAHAEHSAMDDSNSRTMDANLKTLGLTTEEAGMSMDMDLLTTAKPFDRAFIDMMIPHHQGAIRMARAELAQGKDPKLRAIADAIVAAQKKEITQMNSWRKAWYGSSSPAGGVPAA